MCFQRGRRKYGVVGWDIIDAFDIPERDRRAAYDQGGPDFAKWFDMFLFGVPHGIAHNESIGHEILRRKEQSHV